MQAIRTFSNEAAMICAGACASAFALLMATAISNFIRADVDTGPESFGPYLSHYTLPSVPMALTLLLLLAGQRASAMVVAVLGTLFYLGDWLTLAF